MHHPRDHKDALAWALAEADHMERHATLMAQSDPAMPAVGLCRARAAALKLLVEAARKGAAP